MIVISKACKYGLRAVLYLALHSSESNKIGLEVMADELQVPKHFLAKVLQQLSKAEIITSTKGPNGVFFTTEKNLGFTMKEIIETIDGEKALSGCILGLPNCSSKHPCLLHFQAMTYRQGLDYQLKEHTVGEMALRVKRENLII